MDRINLVKVNSETRKTIKQQVIRLHKKGKKGKAIAEDLNLSEFAVSRIVSSFKKEVYQADCPHERPEKHSKDRTTLCRIK